ncbi:HAD family phosphatase [Candidatus Woesearchaeota archaeon]|nr:HAD family phosphatase [Candidatus Woesearchaeota archaeon]
MIKLIIFDIGGILIQEPSSTVMYKNIAQFLGISEEEYNEARKPYWRLATTGELSLKQLYEKVLKKLNKNMKAEDVVKKHLEEYGVIEKVRNPEIIRIIEDLKINYEVVALTNTEQEMGEYNREHGLFQFFEKAFLSTELHMKKPDAVIFQKVLDECNVTADEALFIDDKEENTEGARELGIPCILYENPKQLKKMLEIML